MTHRLDELASLLEPERLYRPFELRRDPSQIPKLGGVYSWWFSEIPPNVPVEGTLRMGGYTLLYVGIAPRKPSSDGARSLGTLRSRLMNHLPRPNRVVYASPHVGDPPNFATSARDFPKSIGQVGTPSGGRIKAVNLARSIR